MRVRYTPLQFIDERNPQGAQNVKRALQRTIELVGQLPESGRRSGVEQTRVLPVGRYPYLVYWSVQGGEAWVVHIRHASRRRWEGRQT
jgi:plasmid stabilization system protein ParE